MRLGSTLPFWFCKPQASNIPDCSPSGKGVHNRGMKSLAAAIATIAAVAASLLCAAEIKLGKKFDPKSVKGGVTLLQIQGTGAVILSN